jgi:S-adenosylmethionine synthetase
VIAEEKLTGIIRETFSLTPRGIIDSLNLRRPVYRATAAYGHFGRREPGFTWEQTDKVDALRKAAGLEASRPAVRDEVAARR